MGRLKKYAKKSKEEFHQYPWKVDYELFALFSKYCESLNLSVNEALSLLVSDEIEVFKQELSDEEHAGILDEYRIKRGMAREVCMRPDMPPGHLPPGHPRGGGRPHPPGRGG